MNIQAKRILFAITLSLYFGTAYSGPLLKAHAVSLCTAHHTINNLHEASKWCFIAAKKGDAHSAKKMEEINQLTESATPPPIDLKNRENLREVCRAHYNINDIYGILRWCKIAADLGDKQSQKIYNNITNTSSPAT